MVISARSKLDDLTSHKLSEFNLRNLTSVKHDVLANFAMYLVNENTRLLTENSKLVNKNTNLVKMAQENVVIVATVMWVM